MPTSPHRSLRAVVAAGFRSVQVATLGVHRSDKHGSMTEKPDHHHAVADAPDNLPRPLDLFRPGSANHPRSRHGPMVRQNIRSTGRRRRCLRKSRRSARRLVQSGRRPLQAGATKAHFRGSVDRHFPANLQIHGNRIYIAPPRELHSLPSPPMTRLWRADHVRKAIWQRFPPSRHTSPVFSTLPSISSAYAGTGLRRRSSIKAKIFWNKIFDTATSASWNVT